MFFIVESIFLGIHIYVYICMCVCRYVFMFYLFGVIVVSSCYWSDVGFASYVCVGKAGFLIASVVCLQFLLWSTSNLLRNFFFLFDLGCCLLVSVM